MAVRGDLADIRLADRVFAPHYAAPLRRAVIADATLRAGRDAASEDLAALSTGEAFDLLDVTGGTGWGIAVDHGVVGYVDVAALGPAS